MANKNYEKGRNFENYIARKLSGKYYMARSAGSKGVFDLVAVSKDRVLGIQCKKNGYLSADELSKILRAAKKYGLKPVLATKAGNRVIFVDLEENKPAEI